MNLNLRHLGNFLVVHWLELGASTAGSWVQSLIGELRSHPKWVARPKTENKSKTAGKQGVHISIRDAGRTVSKVRKLELLNTKCYITKGLKQALACEASEENN